MLSEKNGKERKKEINESIVLGERDLYLKLEHLSKGGLIIAHVFIPLCL